MPKQEPKSRSSQNPRVELRADPNTDSEAARQIHLNSLTGLVYLNGLRESVQRLVGDFDLGQSGLTYFDDLLARMAPRDPAEEMLVAQLLMTHLRVMRLTLLANQQDSRDNIRILNEYADKAINSYRRLILALAEYRRPPRAGDSFTAIKQANIAMQQVVMNGEPNGTENATNEEGSGRAGEPASGPQALPADAGGARVTQGSRGPHEAPGAVRGAEDR